MTEILYPIDIDCVWIALDSNNYIGVFITGGIAPIPVEALNNDIIPFEGIEARIFDLPLVSKSELLISFPRPDDFLAIAERGFFVYDWRDLHRTKERATQSYELVAMPKSPITVDSFPLLIGRLSRKIAFESIEFSTVKSLDVCSLVSCVRAED